MKTIVFSIFCFLTSFFVSLLLLVVCYKVLKKIKAKQTIYEYVAMHKSKAGTPTMGGISFVLGTIISAVFLLEGFVLPAYICIFVMLLNALVGVYDDSIKIKKRQNGGLKPWQKLVLQSIIFGLFGLILIKFDATKIIVPFAKITIDLGWWVVFFSIIIGLFFTNCTNLADGLDGLECFITTPVTTALGAILLLISHSDNFNFVKNAELMTNFGLMSIIFSGAIFSFIFYNSYPAKIFMGDTGSLAVGGFLVAIGFFSGTIIYVLLFGILFVATGISVIMQVSYYKMTKKRIFLMAPLHHHFEKKGYHEAKIATIYFMITMVVSLIIIGVECL